MERKGCEYDICLDPLHLFLGDNNEEIGKDNKVAKGWVSYRYVICHAMWYKLKNHLDTKSVKKKFKEFFDAIKIRKEHYTKDGKFLDIRRLEKSDDILVIDKTHGCYPLLLTKKRWHDFKSALEEVMQKMENILKVLKRHKYDKKWSSEIERELLDEVSWDKPKSN